MDLIDESFLPRIANSRIACLFTMSGVAEDIILEVRYVSAGG